MDVLFVLLPVCLVFVGVAVWLFVWAVRSGQYDDLNTPAVRILFDDENPGNGNGKPDAAAANGTAASAVTTDDAESSAPEVGE